MYCQLACRSTHSLTLCRVYSLWSLTSDQLHDTLLKLKEPLLSSHTAQNLMQECAAAVVSPVVPSQTVQPLIKAPETTLLQMLRGLTLAADLPQRKTMRLLAVWQHAMHGWPTSLVPLSSLNIWIHCSLLPDLFRVILFRGEFAEFQPVLILLEYLLLEGAWHHLQTRLVEPATEPATEPEEVRQDPLAA